MKLSIMDDEAFLLLTYLLQVNTPGTNCFILKTKHRTLLQGLTEASG